MSGKEPLLQESVFFETLNFGFIIMFLIYHRSVDSNALADDVSFLYTILSRLPRFLFKRRKSEPVVFSIVFLTFVVSFSSPSLGQGFLIRASLCCS